MRFEGHHPLRKARPWELYLNEAEGKYRSHGFESTLRRRELEDGHGVSLFILGFNSEGDAVAGVRFHGPLEGSYQAALIEEMSSSPDIGEIARVIDQEVRLGALEGKRGVVERRLDAWSPPCRRAVAVGDARDDVAWRRVCDCRDLRCPHAHRTSDGGPSDRNRVGAFPGRTVPDDRGHVAAGALGGAVVSAPPTGASPRSGTTIRGARFASARVRSTSRPRARSRFAPSCSTSGFVRSERFSRVLREDSSLQLVDRLDEQREQLLQTIPAPKPSIMEEGSRWVYYPGVGRSFALWPPAVHNVAMDRNGNKLTTAEQSRLRTLRVGVIGLSAGHTIAHVLAMEGLVGEIRLADFDTLELSNLNRVPASVLDLGVNKAVVAARRIAEIDPVPSSRGRPRRSPSREPRLLPRWSRRRGRGVRFVGHEVLVREAARDRRIPVIMETSDRGVLDVERFDVDPDRPIFHGLLGDMDSERLAGL